MGVNTHPCNKVNFLTSKNPLTLIGKVEAHEGERKNEKQNYQLNSFCAAAGRWCGQFKQQTQHFLLNE